MAPKAGTPALTAIGCCPARLPSFADRHTLFAGPRGPVAGCESARRRSGWKNLTLPQSAGKQ